VVDGGITLEMSLALAGRLRDSWDAQQSPPR
jgi:hypothetical protein